MNTTPPAVACATSLVDTLVRLGVRDFVLSPGSRSAPLALALADREARGLLRLHVRMDERSAGFFALGIARGCDRPVAVTCTSGSAVANLHPAVVEADYSGVPLLLLTADRPMELRGVGASQTIKQAEIFGGSVRFFADIPAPETGEVDELDRWSDLAARSVDRATSERGPVHLNLAFRAPLVGDAPAPPRESPQSAVGSGPASVGNPGHAARKAGNEAGAYQDLGLDRDYELERGPQLDGNPGQGSRERASLGSESQDTDASAKGDARCGVLVVGDLPLSTHGSTELSQIILWLAEELDWPVISEPTANLSPHPNLLSHGALIAASTEFVADHRPDLVVSVGRFGLSRAVTSLVASAAQHWALAVDGRGEPADPGLSADRILSSLPTGARAVEQLLASRSAKGAAGALDGDSGLPERPSGQSGGSDQSRTVTPAGPAGTADSGWLSDWVAADSAVGRVVRRDVASAAESRKISPADADGLSGAGAALAVWNSLQPDETAFLAASWPIRFIDSLADAPTASRVLANRGANGIDGLVSTALGIATGLGTSVAYESGPEHQKSAGPTGRVVALLGDVAFLHDISGLVGAGQRDTPAVLVVLNNDGGGIFSQLEQAAPQYERDFERVFGTPHGQDLAGIARSMGVSASDVRNVAELQDALRRARAAVGVQVIVAHTSDRREEAALLRHIAAAASAAIQVSGG